MAAAKDTYPVTPAIRLLREKKMPFVPHLYPYVEQGGTGHAAASLQIPEHQVIKTLVMETEAKKPLLVLMHGDREVSTRQLARALPGVKTVSAAAAPATAHRCTGYQVGGISPLGTRTALPVYAPPTLFTLPALYINGGKRGFLVELSPQALSAVLDVQEISALSAAE